MFLCGFLLFHAPLYHLYVDGGSRLGDGGAGCVLYLNDRPQWRGSFWLSQADALTAEYTAMLEGLLAYRRLDRMGLISEEAGSRPIQVYSDSQAVVRNLCLSYETRTTSLGALHCQVASLLDALPAGHNLTHITRELNKEADRLATKALTEQTTLEEVNGDARIAPTSTSVLIRLRMDRVGNEIFFEAYRSIRVWALVDGVRLELPIVAGACVAPSFALDMGALDQEVQIIALDSLRPHWMLRVRLPTSSQWGSRTTLPLPLDLSTSMGALPALLVDFALLRIDEDNLGEFHQPCFLSDHELVREAVRAAARISKLDWLLQTTVQGRTLFESALLLHDRRLTRLLLDIAGRSCFVDMKPDQVIARLCESSDPSDAMQSQVLTKWVSRQRRHK